MKKQAKKQKELEQIGATIEETSDRVDENAAAIERMGPLGIFETSKRVRESIAWSKAKRYASIKGERVDPLKMAEGKFGEQYASPTPHFDYILSDDLVTFRNKFLQFLTNPNE